MILNKYQKLATESNDKYLCIIAGPGTGKTLTITEKIVHLLKKGIKSQEIAALTFTQKAANEMRDRVIDRIGKGDLPFIGTFHLLCIRLLREFLPEEERHFRICRRTIEREIISSFGKKASEKIIEKISRFKNRLIELDSKDRELFELYEQKKKELNLLDFDDLLLRALELIENKTIPPLFSHIIVDEFQDINHVQYELIKGLLRKEGSLAVFGDPDQAIYSFRGSEVDLFLNLPKDFQDLTLLNLSLNYRSQAVIINASNKFITANTKRFSKRIEPTKNEDSKIVLIEVEDEHEEAKVVRNEIKRRLGATDFSELYSNKEEGKYTFSSFAVLARTNSQLNRIKELLTKEGIPVKTIQKDSDTWISDFLRNLSETISDREFAKNLLTYKSLLEFLNSNKLLERYSETEKFLLISVAKNYQKGSLIEQLQAFTDELSGLTPFDLFPDNLNAVSLLTLHSSKGLEFPVVFIVGFDEGIIPYTLADDIDLEEERRLFYVGMTRAMDELILIHAKRRFIKGSSRHFEVSSFLKEIPSDYVERREVRRKRGGPKQKELF